MYCCGAFRLFQAGSAPSILRAFSPETRGARSRRCCFGGDPAGSRQTQAGLPRGGRLRRNQDHMRMEAGPESTRAPLMGRNVPGGACLPLGPSAASPHPQVRDEGLDQRALRSADPSRPRGRFRAILRGWTGSCALVKRKSPPWPVIRADGEEGSGSEVLTWGESGAASGSSASTRFGWGGVSRHLLSASRTEQRPTPTLAGETRVWGQTPSPQLYPNPPLFCLDRCLSYLLSLSR